MFFSCAESLKLMLLKLERLFEAKPINSWMGVVIGPYFQSIKKTSNDLF